MPVRKWQIQCVLKGLVQKYETYGNHMESSTFHVIAVNYYSLTIKSC